MSTLRSRAQGLVALLLIVGIIVGLPAVLIAVGANPLSGDVLQALKHAFTAPDDGTLAVGLIKLLAWASWAFLTFLIVLEVLARVRGGHAPRVPGLRVPQNAARGLVSTAMLLFLTVPAAGAANAAPATVPAAPVSSTQTLTPPTTVPEGTSPTAAASSSAPAPAPEAPRPPTLQHTVKRGETLWSIAVEHLGDGHRYKEILELNRDVLGERPGFLKTGWVLQVPAPAEHASAAERTVVVEKGDTLSAIALRKYGDATRYPQIADASREIIQPDGTRLTDPDLIDVGWTLKVPSAAPARSAPSASPSAPPASGVAAQPSAPSAPASPAPGPATPAAGSQTTAPTEAPAAPTGDTQDLQEDSTAWRARTGYGVGALLAAGVITLLATRRRTQQRRRRPGQRLPAPTGGAALAEQELRVTADPLSVQTVDVALRSLARTCAQDGVPLPPVRAARLTATGFELYLAQPAQLPGPWTGTADDTVWTLEVDHTAQLTDVDLSDVPAPYPALVTIGHDEEDRHVLLNLEHLATLGVTGPDDAAVRDVLAALAVELATSTWADDVQVTLVGAFPDLEDILQTGRIRYVPTVGRLLEDLLERAALDRKALSTAGAGDLHHARVTGAAPDAWAPQIVLLAGQTTTRQREQLEQLATDLPRVAVATITSGLPVGEWGLDLSAGDGPEDAVLSPIGLQLRPQRLPAEQYGHLLQVASLADVDELDPAEAIPQPSLAQVESVTPRDEPDLLVSTLPEVTFTHLQTTQARERSTDPAAIPAHSPLLTYGESPPSTTEETEARPEEPPDATKLDASHPGAQEVPSTAEGSAPTTLSAAVPDPTSTAAVLTDGQTSTRTSPASAASTPDEERIDPLAFDDQQEPARPLPLPAPRICVLGPVTLLNTAGKVEPTKRSRLLEYAAYLALHPGATHTAIDNAIWPDRPTEDNLNTRNTATSKLRRWVGTDPVTGQEYLPRLQAGEGYAFHPVVTTDAADWDQLLGHDPLNASTEHLEQALQLVRGVPFEGTHRKRYAWAEPVKQRLISEIVDVSYELARRRLMDGRWRGAEQAVVVGLRVEPAQESLWRLRILTAHESRNPAAEAEAIERLLTITEQLECDLEPETMQLLAALKNPGATFDQLADAL